MYTVNLLIKTQPRTDILQIENAGLLVGLLLFVYRNLTIKTQTHATHTDKTR